MDKPNHGHGYLPYAGEFSSYRTSSLFSHEIPGPGSPGRTRHSVIAHSPGAQRCPPRFRFLGPRPINSIEQYPINRLLVALSTAITALFLGIMGTKTALLGSPPCIFSCTLFFISSVFLQRVLLLSLSRHSFYSSEFQSATPVQSFFMLQFQRCRPAILFL